MTTTEVAGLVTESTRVDAVCMAHAARLVDRVGDARFALLTAPTGFGKTFIAGQIAQESGRRVAWCSIRPRTSEASLWVDICRKVLERWPDAPNQPGDVSESNAPKLLIPCLDVVGETLLVLDDVDHLDDGALDAALGTLGPFGSLRVLVTSQLGPTPALVSLEAAGDLTRLDALDLGFDEEQCVQMVSNDHRGRALAVATGGWPIAVLLAARNGNDRAPCGLDDSLLQLFLTAHPMFDRSRLAVAALLDGFPDALLPWFQTTPERRRDDTAHGLLIQRVGNGQSIRQWAREALRFDPIDASLAEQAIAILRRTEDDETWITLAIETGRMDLATRAAERFCADMITAGRHDRVRRLVDRIAPEDRTLDLQTSAVLAEQATAHRRPHEHTLHELVRRARRPDGQPSPRANAALANHLRLVGDPTVIEVCHEVVAPLIELSPDDAAATARSLWPDLPDRIAAGELLRFLGQCTMFSAGSGTFATGRRLVQSALRIMEDEHSVRSQQGWLLYIEAMMFVHDPSQVVLRARTIAMEVWRARHTDAALRLSELAVLEFFAGLHDRARSTIELAREASAETGNDLAAIPLAGLECALNVIDERDATDRVEQFERAIFELLDHDYLAVFHQAFAAEFGILQLRLGNAARAARFCTIAEQSPETFMSSSFALRRRRLRALLLVEDDHRAGRRALGELRTLAISQDRAALVDLLDRDLGGATIADQARTEADEALGIVALAPAFSIVRGTTEFPAPNGYTAKLLALLVASSGVVAIDVALEDLWPGADPRVSRNRLHGVLLRLRRALGFGPDGPLTCRDELVRLEAGPDLSCDAWALEATLRAGANVEGVDHLLSEQFRYDDRVSRYRDDLRRLAAGHTCGSGGSVDPEFSGA